MHILSCPERDELEKQVGAVLNQLVAKSKLAKQMTEIDARQADLGDFEAMREEHAVLSERIRVLRECLQLHKGWHGC